MGHTRKLGRLPFRRGLSVRRKSPETASQECGRVSCSQSQEPFNCPLVRFRRQRAGWGSLRSIRRARRTRSQPCISVGKYPAVASARSCARWGWPKRTLSCRKPSKPGSAGRQDPEGAGKKAGGWCLHSACTGATASCNPFFPADGSRLSTSYQNVRLGRGPRGLA